MKEIKQIIHEFKIIFYNLETQPSDRSDNKHLSLPVQTWGHNFRGSPDSDSEPRNPSFSRPETEAMTLELNWNRSNVSIGTGTRANRWPDKSNSYLASIGVT